MMFNNLVIPTQTENIYQGRGLGQGWGISCLLFNIFTDDLTDEYLRQPKIHPSIFADDTNVLGTQMNNLNTTIEISESWARNNKMIINVKKSKIMIIDESDKF